MTLRAFDLTAPDSGEMDSAFLAAWKRAIKLSGHPAWFGGSDPVFLDRARDKNQLQPRVKEITKHITAIPISNAFLVAAMVSFFNPALGATLANKIHANGIGGISTALNSAQRMALSQLIINYQGW